jgi:hypothetical protein
MAVDRLSNGRPSRRSQPDAGFEDRLWAGVRELVARAPGPEGSLHHGLQMFDVEARLGAGAPLPPALEAARLHAQLGALMVPVLLERIRDTLDQPVVLMKGAEIAARYPDPSLRPFNDVDLLVEDPVAAYDRLRANGFEPAGDPGLYVDHHHLQPLRLPSCPLPLELHHGPSVMPWMTGPSTAELIADSVPSATCVDGIRGVRPDQHALLLAVHGWGHWPFGRALDLVDVLAASHGSDRDHLDRLARAWNMSEVWRTTTRVAEAVLLHPGTGRPWPLRTWARHIPECRRQTDFEKRLTRTVSPFAAVSPPRAVARGLSRIRHSLPRADEAQTQAVGGTDGQPGQPTGERH